MGFQNLADVHPRRHAERIQHEIDRRSIGHVRHVFDRHDARDDTFVAVASRHLVARLQAALDGQIHLDHLQHARRQFVTLRQLFLLVFECLIELLTLLLDRILQRFELRRGVVIGQPNLEPVILLER